MIDLLTRKADELLKEMEAIKSERVRINSGKKVWNEINPRKALEAIRDEAQQGKIEEFSLLPSDYVYSAEHARRNKYHKNTFFRKAVIRDLPTPEGHTPKSRFHVSEITITVTSTESSHYGKTYEEVRRDQYKPEVRVTIMGGGENKPRSLDPTKPDFPEQYRNALSKAYKNRYYESPPIDGNPSWFSYKGPRLSHQEVQALRKLTTRR